MYCMSNVYISSVRFGLYLYSFVKLILRLDIHFQLVFQSPRPSHIGSCVYVRCGHISGHIFNVNILSDNLLKTG